MECTERNIAFGRREVCDAAPHATSVYSLLKFQDEGEP